MSTNNSSLTKISHTTDLSADLPGIVISQWQRASAGLVEIIRFGALMIKIDQGLTENGKKRNQHSNQTLKGWLSEHCHEINYNTARGYKDAAAGLAAAAELPDTMPLLSIMEGDNAFTDELQSAHDKVMAVLASSSIAFLKASSRRGGARIGAGRPAKADPDPEAATTEALLVASELLDNMRRWVLDGDGLGNLPDDALDTWLVSLGDVIKRGREIQSGRKLAQKTRGI